MSKSEDYLDDLLNSVSDANRRNNKKDIENLIQSMNEEAAKPREREKKPVEKKHEDYSGTGFQREFEQELATGEADDFLQEFEMELDEEASNQADIDVNEDKTSDMEAASEPISSETTDMATDESAASDMMEDVNDIMDAVRKKVGDSGEEEHPDTSKTPEDDASEEEETLGFLIRRMKIRRRRYRKHQRQNLRKRNRFFQKMMMPLILWICYPEMLTYPISAIC